jgi:tripartite ATP-independent transporter DctM subunit
MDWYFVLLIIFASLCILMATGMPVALSFMLINMIGLYIYFGGFNGIQQISASFFSTLTNFTLLPVPLFILMGEVMFQSGIAAEIIKATDKWIGRVPGRLSLISVSAGVILSTLTGTSLASVAMLGSVLTPEMEKQGYQKSMSLGPIMGSGGLAMMIPPSALAVLCGAIGEISVSKILMAIIIPGLMMAVIYAAYIIIRCWLQPSIAPRYEMPPTPLSEKLMATLKYIVPMGFIVFLVIGIIFLGVATPSEAAATGTLGAFIIAIIYGRLTWANTKNIITGTLSVAGMIFLIMGGATAFSQILGFSGASAGLGNWASTLPVSPIVVFIAMQIVVLALGCFMDVVSIMMITLPIFAPVIRELGFSDVWFATIFLVNIEIAGISPPFGMSLFVMKGVAPPNTTMGDVYRAALPFCAMGILAMALITAFPALALWLPSNMLR